MVPVATHYKTTIPTIKLMQALILRASSAARQASGSAAKKRGTCLLLHAAGAVLRRTLVCPWQGSDHRTWPHRILPHGLQRPKRQNGLGKRPAAHLRCGTRPGPGAIGSFLPLALWWARCVRHGRFPDCEQPAAERQSGVRFHVRAIVSHRRACRCQR